MGALGYVMQVPEEEKYLMKKGELLDQITTLLGGRAAEEVEFDDVTTGASNDIEKATSIARAMVTQYGMSERFGMMGLETISSRYLDGRPVTNCGEATESEIDDEVKSILERCHEKAKQIITENKKRRSPGMSLWKSLRRRRGFISRKRIRTDPQLRMRINPTHRRKRSLTIRTLRWKSSQLMGALRWKMTQKTSLNNIFSVILC